MYNRSFETKTEIEVTVRASETPGVVLVAIDGEAFCFQATDAARLASMIFEAVKDANWLKESR